MYGTTQKVQNLSQPSCTVRNAETVVAVARSLAAGRGDADGPQKMHVPQSGFRQVVELRIRRKFGLDRASLALQKRRQTMIALRPDDDVNRLRPLQNFLALGLRDAARDGDFHVTPFGARGLL